MASLLRFSMVARAHAGLGKWLLAERDQLPVWIVVAFGAGIAAWFALPGGQWPVAVIALSLAGALALLAWCGSWAAMELGARCLFAGLLMLAAGCATMAWRAERVAADPLPAPWFGTLTGRIEARETIPARDIVRLTIRPAPALGLPQGVRVNLDLKLDSPALQPGAIVSGRARLMPPAQAALPGGYSFAQALPSAPGSTGWARPEACSTVRACSGPAARQDRSIRCARGFRRISRHRCPAGRAGSRRLWRREIAARSARRMPRRCGRAASRICSRSAGCTSPR